MDAHQAQLRFSCPACGTLLVAAAREHSRVVACSGCGGPVELAGLAGGTVPVVLPDDDLPSSSGSNPEQPTPPVSSDHRAEEYGHECLDLDARRARRRSRAARRRLLAAVGLTVFAAFLAGGAVAIARAKLNRRAEADSASAAEQRRTPISQPQPKKADEPTRKVVSPRPANQVPKSQPKTQTRPQGNPPPKEPPVAPAPPVFRPAQPQPLPGDNPFFPAPGGGPFFPPPGEELGAPAAPPKALPPEPPIPNFKSDRPAKEATPGYFLRTPLGFKMVVSRLAYEESDAASGRPLRALDDELGRLAEIFGERELKALKAVPIWVEWDHAIPRQARAFAVYYGGDGEGLFFEGVDPRKASCICVLSLKTAYNLKREGRQRQNVLLHEFAHVIHSVILGRDNPGVANAYDQATARGLYRAVAHDDGTTGRAYAATNEAEYFADLTCAYLDGLHYYPHDRAELRTHDSVGYTVSSAATNSPCSTAARPHSCSAFASANSSGVGAWPASFRSVASRMRFFRSKPGPIRLPRPAAARFRRISRPLHAAIRSAGVSGPDRTSDTEEEPRAFDRVVFCFAAARGRLDRYWTGAMDLAGGEAGTPGCGG